jgi:hypothetical protein
MGPIPWDQMQLVVRRGVAANHLPSNQELPNDVTAESLQTGWTVQQPYAHTYSVVPLVCVICGSALYRRDWADHDCIVEDALPTPLWSA